jgi:adenylate cyclase
MRITCLYQGTKKIWQTSESEVIFGRTEEKLPVTLDLSPDLSVSRVHGRIWQADGSCWIEDLDSSGGTFLNGNEIKGRGIQCLRANDLVLVGQTRLRVDLSEKFGIQQTHYLEQGIFLLPEKRGGESGIEVTKKVDPAGADSSGFADFENVSPHRLQGICNLPFQLASRTTLDLLVPSIVEQLTEIIPAAQNWALVLRDQDSGTLVLKAFRHVHEPYLNEGLLQKVIAECKGVHWRRHLTAPGSAAESPSGVTCGIYAPLLWHGDALGTLCVGSSGCEAAFSEEDLKLLVIAGQYAATAIATVRLQERLRREAVTKANLLRQFSPKVADELLARRGNLRLGGRRSEVTILNCDIRGFAQLVKEMEPDQVVELLNAYLGVLVPVVFAHNGTIDKFMGDAILAVFGSPGSDPRHHENASRAAVEMQVAVNRLNQAREQQSAPRCDFGTGLHCGEVVHGFVGTADRMEFTLVGDAVNRAQRYCAAAAAQEILISPELYTHVSELLEAQPTTVHTKHEGDFLAYRIIYLKESNETVAIPFPVAPH